MNFDRMWSVKHNHSDVMYVISLISKYMCLQRNSYWIIAIPLMAIVVPLFLLNDLKRMVHFVQKKIIAKDVKKVAQHNVFLIGLILRLMANVT